MAKIYRHSLQLPTTYYSAIGETLYRWALLEYQMQEIIWRALDIDNKKGRTLTVGMGSRTLIGILRTLSRRWAANKTEAQMLNSLANGASQIVETRNNIAHGTWQYPRGGKATDIHLIYMKASDQRIMPKAEKTRAAHVRSTARKIRHLNERAEKIIARLEARQQSSS